jgi:chromosome segregation protein
MLKALELVGFKSFADKTRFDFAKGITAVVGPNGSGKSNVVDAIKWVLGEQSVKSLRGKEMADCIFNGSATRHPLNAAEVTLTFDNAQKRLPVDAPEVSVTRRIYRGGEGEYLINRQPCRLRDIRDLFSGTGVATEAYSVIEQGKVDVMLQASPKDRRAIFEEAAGISRFKAKKLESLRRLERVEQNLLRLSDIVDEVGNRLRTVRMQASKARRYREYADRLRELRTQVGLADWRRLSERLAEQEAELAELAGARDAALARAQQIEAESHELDRRLSESAEARRTCDSAIAENRERIASREGDISNWRGRCQEAEAEFDRLLGQLSALRVRAGDLAQQLADTTAAVAEAERLHAEKAAGLAAGDRELAERAGEMETLRADYEAGRSASLEATRAAAALETEAATLEKALGVADAALERRQIQSHELAETRQGLSVELDELRSHERELTDAADRASTDLATAQDQLAALVAQRQSRALEAGQLRERLAAVTERVNIIEELEQRQEGLAAGVKQVLAEMPGGGPLAAVRGMLADLLHVNVEMAAPIEAALADRAQAFAVEPDAAFLDWLRHESPRLPGRVVFLPLSAPETGGWDEPPDLAGLPGVHGRADHFIDAEASLSPLVRRLLGRTWIAEGLDDVLALASGPGRGLTWVTLAGEMIAADGAICVGPPHLGMGIISRRSELRALRDQLATLTVQTSLAAKQLAQIDQRTEEANQRTVACGETQRRASESLNEHRPKVQAAEARLLQLTEQLAAMAAEQAQARAERQATAEAVTGVGQRLLDARARLAGIEQSAAAARDRMKQADERRQDSQRLVGAAQVEHAKSGERLANLRTRLEQLERDQQERGRSIAGCRRQMSDARERQTQAEARLLRVESELAGLYLRKESLSAETVALAAQHGEERSERARLMEQAQAAHADARSLEQERHARDLAANELRHERGALVDRLREDYQIELAALEHEATAEEGAERERIDQEITDLRRKLNHLGAVNLDALDELDELESRHTTLSTQFQDLTQAKDSLTRIIGKIDADSRRLFVETLEAVKVNFQGLFRKLFGGGQADIVFDESTDILDGGIEVVARPPGKELRAISLLSGGEKTLTCVALLLAIFQYRPSPFCVLDEVDAALDEANIERFIGVLEEFLAWTQFIVVTHSKKTMTCAATLYGVTMEESGVSKRVSVRFEDISDEEGAGLRIRDSA